MRDDDSANRWSGVREAPTAPSRQLTGAVVIIALVAAISGMLYGYDTGVISWALLQLTQDFNITEGWQQVIAASILLGAVAGALTCSWLSDLRGRRGTLLMLAVVFIVGALWCADAADSVMLSLGRLVLGFAVGGATQTAPMYVAELAPPAYRGRLVLCFQIAIGVGILTATLVGAGGSISWRGPIGLACVPAAIMLWLLLRLPESPRWLVKKDNRDAARAVLEHVRPEGYDVAAELDEATELARVERTAATRGWRGLRDAWVRPALVLGCGIAVFTQLSGIEMIIYYSPTILTDDGVYRSVALQVSVCLGAAYLIAQLVGLAIIDRVGRRRLTLIMVPGAAISLFALGLLFITSDSGRDVIPYIMICLIAFMLFNGGGLQLMGWLTGSETYPLAVRPAATALQSATLWGTNLVITLTMLSLIKAIGVGPSMWLYALFNVAAWIFVFFRMPDLTGKTLEEIEYQLSEGKFRPSDFGR
ncbi:MULTISPECIES: sugar porter family MFS transporter [Mycobacterium avium complex (MAC)]|uniref:sugar porter family MFS transporter n=1 Tax=Mycobacterium avium complex (MAC) TaxID=120793 RepID=UPI0003D1D146|nr:MULTISPECIES: sugar porter family MFS transporter [Mycobacterium avium complex (MAC)]ETA90622.1 transporter [Mycobacterium avium 05-4293]ETB12015.1 transporter [Mycobacterium avium subsp. avium 10-9275]MDO2355201.1 sugar porter family MFS transporter [Mycobacterium avium subsp. hominissuis]